MDDHHGQVIFDGTEYGAILKTRDGRLLLEMSTPSTMTPPSPTSDLAQFRSATGYFTLVGLRSAGSKFLLGVGGAASFSVRYAIQKANFEQIDDIRSDTWLLYVEDFARIHHVTGFHSEFTLDVSGKTTVNWRFTSPPTVTLDCPNAGLIVALGQDGSIGSDTVAAPTMRFAYPMTVTFPAPVDLNSALPILHRIRLFCSLLMGRVLDIDRVVLRLEDDGRRHDADLLGLRPVARSTRPERRLLDFDAAETLAPLLDSWLMQADNLDEAIGLHFQGLEQEHLDWSLRFQLFIQAIEAAHRRSGGAIGPAITIDPVVTALKDRGISKDVIDRVKGVLAHAHEPGLRQRLKDYWRAFEAELKTLRPDTKPKALISRIVATRNYYAHRMDLTSDVAQGADLWDATELVKALSHMVLLNAVGADLAGLGGKMIDERFVRFSIRT